VDRRWAGHHLTVKWAILAVVVILVAPTIANRLTPGDARTTGAEQRRRGLLYRAVRRFGLRRVSVAVITLGTAVVVIAYVLIRAA